MAKDKAKQQTLAQYLAAYINYEKDQHSNSVVDAAMMQEAIEAFESTEGKIVIQQPVEKLCFDFRIDKATALFLLKHNCLKRHVEIMCREYGNLDSDTDNWTGVYHDDVEDLEDKEYQTFELLLQQPYFPISYTEIKRPFAYLSKGDGDTRSVWWRDGEYVVCFDDIPENYPRWTIGCLTIKEAKKRVKEMTRKEGWELIESNMEV